MVARRGAARFAPDAELGPDDIDALGAEDVGAVIARTLESLGEPEAPLIIVNGRRMADPSVFYGFPPDALARVEALPPHAAAAYGADPRRRVLNIVLQQSFMSRDGRLEAAGPMAGGMVGLAGDLRTSAIADDRARQAGVRVTRETSLRADERRDPSGDAAPAAAGTLRPEADTLSANLMRTGALGTWSTSLGANGRVQAARTQSQVEGQVVAGRREMANLALTAGLGGEVWGWPLQAGLKAQVSRLDQSGVLATASTVTALSATADLSRSLAELPAGSITINLSGEASAFHAIRRLAGDTDAESFAAGAFAGSLNIPLSTGAPPETDQPRASALGEASLQLGANLRQVGADGGAGATVSMSWAPIRTMRMTAAWSTSAEGLDDAQRSSPVFVGAPILVYDFQTGSATEVLPIQGGAPELKAPRLSQFSAGLSVGPFTGWKLAGTVNFRSVEAANGVGVLPIPTPQVEAAFPERFQRDATGRLISIDLRPLNLHEARTETLSSNLSLAAPFGRDDGHPAGLLRLALNHTWQLRNDLVIRPGLPVLDRRAGDGGGAPDHEFGLILDVRRGALGGGATMRWRAGYRVRREAGQDGPDDLVVSDFGAIDAKLTYRFADARPPTDAGAPARRGAGVQLEIGIENVFDARPRARLGDGRPAPGYGRDDQDPVGRRLRIAVASRF